MLTRHLDRAVTDERWSTGQHFEHHDSQRVDVAATINRRALGLLGREVRRGPHDQPRLGEMIFTGDRLGDTEVGDLHLRVRGNQNVARLHVSVHHSLSMGVAEGGGHLRPELGGTRRRQYPTTTKNLGEGLALHQLHHDEVRSAVLAPVKDRNNVGVREVGGGLGLPAKSFDEGGIGAQFGVENFERDGTVKELVLGAIDQGHAAARNQVGYLVAVGIDAWFGDGLHVSPSLRPRASI